MFENSDKHPPEDEVWGCEDSRKYFNEMGRDFGQLSHKSFRHASEKDRKFIGRILRGHPKTNRLIACNGPIRFWTSEVFTSVIAKSWRIGRKNGMHYYLVTIVDPRFYTGDSVTQINVPKIKRRSAAILLDIIKRFGGYHVSCVEVQGMIDKHLEDEFGEDSGRVLCGHTHSVLVVPKLISPRLLAEDLSKSFGPTVAGVKPVHIVKIDPDQKDIEHATRYIVKSPLYQKCLGKSGTKDQIEAGDGRLKMCGSFAKKNGRLVRRVAEILSHIDMNNLIFAGGEEGEAIKDECLHAVRAILKAHGMKVKKSSKHADRYSAENIAKVWAREREIASGTPYTTPTIMAT